MKKYNKKIILLLIVVIMSLTCSCGKSVEAKVPDDYNYEDLSSYIVLGNYKGVTYKDTSKVTVAEQNSVVKIDFVGSVNGKEFEGGSGKDYQLDLAHSTFIEGFAEQIVGHSVGETFDVNVTFPKDYQEKSLAGKPALFKTTLKSIEKSEANEQEEVFNKIVAESKVKKYPQKEYKKIYEKIKTGYQGKGKQELKKLAQSEEKKELVLYALAQKVGFKPTDDDYKNYLLSLLKKANITEDQFLEQNGMTIYKYAEDYNLFITYLNENVMKKVMKYAVGE